MNTGAVVIIPNFNGLKFLGDCIHALQNQSYRDFSVLVVDNGSTDGSKEFLDETSASSDSNFSLKVISLEKNLGFAGACNIGIREASGAEYIVLLNNDTVPDRDYLKELLKPFSEDMSGRLGAVTPLMLSMHESSGIDDAGDGFTILGWAFQRGVGQSASKSRFLKERKVLSACAGAAAYRTDALTEADRTGGVFDPAHFAYLEDIDLSLRLFLSGYYTLYTPRSKVLHFGSGTTGARYSDFKVRLSSRNNIYLIYKNFPILITLLNLPFLITGAFVKWLFFLSRGFGRAYMEGLIEGLWTLGSVRQRKLHFEPAKTALYIKLELLMVRDTFSYMRDLITRRF